MGFLGFFLFDWVGGGGEQVLVVVVWFFGWRGEGSSGFCDVTVVLGSVSSGLVCLFHHLLHFLLYAAVHGH